MGVSASNRSNRLLGAAEAASLAVLLRTMPRLKSLGLNLDRIDAAGAASLAAVLTSMTMDFDEEDEELEFSKG